jgi:hypothetical protein
MTNVIEFDFAYNQRGHLCDLNSFNFTQRVRMLNQLSNCGRYPFDISFKSNRFVIIQCHFKFNQTWYRIWSGEYFHLVHKS